MMAESAFARKPTSGGREIVEMAGAAHGGSGECTELLVRKRRWSQVDSDEAGTMAAAGRRSEGGAPVGSELGESLMEEGVLLAHSVSLREDEDAGRKAARVCETVVPGRGHGSPAEVGTKDEVAAGIPAALPVPERDKGAGVGMGRGGGAGRSDRP